MSALRRVKPAEGGGGAGHNGEPDHVLHDGAEPGRGDQDRWSRCDGTVSCDEALSEDVELKTSEPYSNG